MTAADSASTMDQIKSPVTFVGVVAVAICSVIVIMFVTIFTVLQVSLNAEDGRYIYFFQIMTFDVLNYKKIDVSMLA